MLSNIYHKFFNKYEAATSIKKREINPNYIIDEDIRSKYIKDGFVVIKNIVNDDIIQKVLDTFENIKKCLVILSLINYKLQ